MFLAHFSSVAQEQIIYNNSYSKTHYLRSTSDYARNYNNEVIKILAKGNNKSVASTGIELNAKWEQLIIRRSTRLIFKVYLTPQQLNGDFRYRDFSVKETLVPHLVNFKIVWLDRNKRAIKNYTVKNAKVQRKRSLVGEISQIDTSGRKKYSLKIENIKFAFDRRNIEKLNEKINLINAYYNTISKLNHDLNSLNKIDLSDIDNIKKSASVVKQNFISISNVKNRNYTDKLKLLDYDPAGLLNTITIIETKCKDLDYAIRDIIRNLHIIYYERGLEALQNRNAYSARDCFNKSLQNDRKYAPSHFQLAQLDYNNGRIDAATNRIIEMQSMELDVVRDNVINLTEIIITDILSKASKYNNSGFFDKAIEQINSALKLCRKVNGVQCPSAIEREYSRSYNGIYRNFLQEIEKAVSNQDFKSAENLIAKTRRLQSSKSRYIPDNDLIAPMILNIYDGYVLQGQTAYDNENYKNAVVSFLNAKRLCEKETAIACGDKLNISIFDARTGVYNKMLQQASIEKEDDKLHEALKTLNEADIYRKQYQIKESYLAERIFLSVQQQFYDNNIEEAQNYISALKFQSALKSLDFAANIEKKYLINSDKNLPVLVKKASKSLIKKLIEKSKYSLRKNKTYEARSYFSEANQIMQLYLPKGDEEMKTLLETLRERIFSAECHNLQVEFNSASDKAIRLAGQYKFIEAENAYDKALQIPQRLPECSIATQMIVEKRDKVSIAASYQRLINEAKSNVKTQKYQLSITSYNAATKYYNENKIEKYGLVHSTSTDFFVLSGDVQYIYFGAKHFITKKEYENSLLMLRELEKKGIRKSNTKLIQINLGIQLALKDHGETPSVNPKYNILRYSMGNRWFKYMKRAYIKQWRKLR